MPDRSNCSIWPIPESAELTFMAEPRGSRLSLASVALVLSVALNLCVVAGFLYSRWMGPPFPGGEGGHLTEMMAERLDLTPQQKPAFDELRGTLHKAHDELRAQNRPSLRTVWDELQRDTPDQQKILAALEEVNAHHRALQVAASSAIIRFMAVLTPEQRATMAEAVLDPHDPAGALIRNVGK
jgi:Spy/CpxP family protein refolding chaperone